MAIKGVVCIRPWSTTSSCMSNDSVGRNCNELHSKYYPRQWATDAGLHVSENDEWKSWLYFEFSKCVRGEEIVDLKFLFD